MPSYTYENPLTGETKDIVQRMNDQHTYFENGVEWKRVFTKPQAAIDTHINPESSRDFVDKMGRKKCTLGNMQDESAVLSQKREKTMGKDPVKEKYYDSYSKKRKGRPHPDLIKKKTSSTIEIEL
jgi:hypothetical protein